MNYHIDMLPGDLHKKAPHTFSEEGVILTKIPYTNNYRYHLTSIAACALEEKDIIKPNLEWIVKNLKETGYYKHNFSFPFYYGFPDEWIGGLAQGLAISALVKHDKLEIAEKAFDALCEHCLFEDSHNNLWIEEYPLAEPAHILNGFIYSLFGVYDLYEATGNKKAKEIWDGGIKTLVNKLDEYDMDGAWSKYDLFEQLPAQPFYHQVHVKQLNELYLLTDEPLFKEYAEKWHGKKFTANLKKKCVEHAFMKYGIKGAFARNKQRKRWLRGK